MGQSERVYIGSGELLKAVHMKVLTLVIRNTSNINTRIAYILLSQFTLVIVHHLLIITLSHFAENAWPHDNVIFSVFRDLDYYGSIDSELL